jgi:hypothetical protein
MKTTKYEAHFSRDEQYIYANSRWPVFCPKYGCFAYHCHNTFGYTTKLTVFVYCLHDQYNTIQDLKFIIYHIHHDMFRPVITAINGQCHNNIKARTEVEALLLTIKTQANNYVIMPTMGQYNIYQ